MRAVLAMAFLGLSGLGLSACNSEPTFDERYAAAKKHVDANSRKIDAELKERAKAAADAQSTDPAPLVIEDASGSI